MQDYSQLSSKDFDQFEINRIIHLEQIPGYQLLKWERDYLKNYRTALRKEMKEQGIVSAGGPLYDDLETSTEEISTEASEEVKETTKKKTTKTKTTK